MKIPTNKQIKYLVGAVLVVVAFVALAQWSQQYNELLSELVNQAGWMGLLSYITITAISIIIAPIGTGFLLPVAANSYGPFLTAVYSIIGWTSGSLVAFWIARRFGSSTTKYQNFITLIQNYEKDIPKYRFYAIVVLFRMALPVDVLSYALGFASTISYSAFFVTTIIGVTPMTILFTYAAVSAVRVQILVGVIAVLAFSAGIYVVYREQKSPTS